MTYATIFWRGNGDDFIVTEVAFVESETQNGLDITASEWVEMAIREESRLDDLTAEEIEEEVKEALNNFELLAVIKGKVEYYY